MTQSCESCAGEDFDSMQIVYNLNALVTWPLTPQKDRSSAPVGWLAEVLGSRFVMRKFKQKEPWNAALLRLETSTDRVDVSDPDSDSEPMILELFNPGVPRTKVQGPS
jgi:hypothetical protein